MAIGKFVVSSLTHPTDAGGFRASVTVSSGHGQASSHRVFRLQRQFASSNAAHVVALSQGWLQVCSPQSART